MGKVLEIMPHALTVLIGAVLLFLCHPLLSLSYLIVSVVGMLWFWGTICPNCLGYGSRGCPSGHGLISARLFKKAKKPDFKKAFKRNIIAVAVQWFIPLVSIYWIVTDFDPLKLGMLILFCLVGFIWLPYASRKKGCRRCPQQVDCPWKK